MRFREWLQNEVGLNLTQPPDPTANPAQASQATDQVAKQTTQKFGSDLTAQVSKAPTKPMALKAVTGFAQKTMNTNQKSQQLPTNPALVAGKIYSDLTGEQPKTQ